MRNRLRSTILLGVASVGAWGLGNGLPAYAQPVYAQPVYAQPAAVFAGDYALAGHRGSATFDYRLDGGDTVRVGDFDFRAYDARDLLSDGDDYVAIRGRFDDAGVATGPWRFDFGELSAADVSEVRDLRYHLAVNGERRRTTGQLEGGRAEGVWRTVTERIRRSAPADTLFESRFTYAAGVPQQTFRLKTPDAELLGLVTRGGLAEDAWALFGDGDGDGEREWQYHNGLLLSVTEGGRAVDVFGDYRGDTLHVALDGDYLRLLDAWRTIRGGAGPQTDQGIARLLGLNAAAYAEVNAAIGALGLRGDGPRIRVAVPSAPLSPREATQLERISAGLLRFNAEAAGVLGAGDLGAEDLWRVTGADEEAAFLRAAARAIAEEWVGPVRQLDTAYHRGLLRSLPRADYLAALWPAGAVDGRLEVVFDSPSGPQTRAYGPGEATGAAERFDVGAGGLGAVDALLDYATAAVTDIRARLAAKAAAADRSGADLVAGASRIEATYARLDSLIGAQPRRLVKEVGLNRVARLAAATVSDYRGRDVLGRQRAVASVGECLDDLLALAVALRNVPAHEARVEDAYTDEVWNNIIATVMTERVKKRITEAYTERLVPYYLTQVREGLSCDNAAGIAVGLTAVYERVMDLRDADTEALEDELRGVRDPRQLLTLLSVAPVN